MVYGDLQFFDIIIFAGIAVFIIYRLRSVLGKRTGFEKNNTTEVPQPPKKVEKNEHTPVLKENEQKLETIYNNISDFDHKSFLEGSKKAFEIIITAFNQGDKKTLKNLVSKDVYEAFEKAINNNENNPASQFYSLVVDGIDDARVTQDNIIISVRFISEQLLDNKEDKITKNQDTWTFEKKIGSKSPIWTLTST